jgi:hypothetical protein
MNNVKTFDRKQWQKMISDAVNKNRVKYVPKYIHNCKKDRVKVNTPLEINK